MYADLEIIIRQFSALSILHALAILYFTGLSLYVYFREAKGKADKLFAITGLALALRYSLALAQQLSIDRQTHFILAQLELAYLYLFPILVMSVLRLLSFFRNKLKKEAGILITMALFYGSGQFLYPTAFVAFSLKDTSHVFYLSPSVFLGVYYVLALVGIYWRIRRNFFGYYEDTIEGKHYYILGVLFLYSLHPINYFFKGPLPVVADFFATITMYYLISRRYLWTLSELLKKFFFWFIASSLPIIPLSFITLWLVNNAHTIDSKIIFALITTFFYLLFYYFRQFQPQIDLYFTRITRDLAGHIESYRSKLIIMLTTLDLIEILKHVIEKVFHVTHFGVFFWHDELGVYAPVGHRLPPENLKFKVYNDFFLWLGEQDTFFTREEFLHEDHLQGIRTAALDFFERTKTRIVVPFSLNKSLLAVLYLGEKLNGSNFTKNEFNFLAELQSITSIALSNALLFERITALNDTLEEKVQIRTRDLEEAQSQLVHSEKLASLGIMVAGIAHEVNTPAGVIFGSIQNIGQSLVDFLNLALNSASAELTQVIHDVVSETRKKHLNASQRYLQVKKISKKLIEENKLEKDDASARAGFIVDYNQQENSNAIAKLSVQEFFTATTLSNLKQNIHNIHYSIEAIVRIVTALKFYSHIDQANAEVTDIREGLENTLIILHNQLKHGVEIKRHYDEVQPIQCFVGELNQIWTNLITNSVHAMDGSGTIEIFISEIELSIYPDRKRIHAEKDIDALISDTPAHPFMKVTIQDSGSGISQEIQAKVFDPFFTTKKQGEGTGLGLGIVRNIVKKHKGFLSLFSEPGKTKISIYLPSKRKL